MRKGYIDIHSHILPGVDDGAADINMSLEMLRLAQTGGIKEVILTPHNKPMRHNVSISSMHRRMEELQERMQEEGIDIRLYAGNEVYYRSEITRLLDEGDACTLADSSYVLVEFNPMDEFDYLRNGIYQLMTGGYRPVLAHAERYRCISTSPERVQELVGMGCYIQINAGSIMGRYGWQTRHFSRQILKRRLVHFVATDAHRDAGKRAPYMAACGKYIKKYFGEEYMWQLLGVHPQRIIADEYI